jgi:vancomycin permeability regulator SanA
MAYQTILCIYFYADKARAFNNYSGDVVLWSRVRANKVFWLSHIVAVFVISQGYASKVALATVSC